MNRRREEGFTLVELMMVTLILSALVFITIPLYNTVKARAQTQTCVANQTIASRASAVYVSALATSPANVTDLIAAGYLKAAPRCPSGGVYVYSSRRTGGTDTLNCSIHPAP